MGVAPSSSLRVRAGEIWRERPGAIEFSWSRLARPGCTLRDLCLSEGLDPGALSQLNQLIAGRTRLRKADTLFRAGERFMSLYAIRSGSCKTVSLAEDGREQVAGYHMSGEIIGTDGICNDHYSSGAVALEDTEVYVLPFGRLEAFGQQQIGFQHNLHRLLSQEITRQAKVMLVLGTMAAEQRLAAFLLDLADRYRARGYSASEFRLRLTREEIGSYLGLKLETVSRLFSRFQREGLLQVQGRVIKLLDRTSLRHIIESSD